MKDLLGLERGARVAREVLYVALPGKPSTEDSRAMKFLLSTLKKALVPTAPRRARRTDAQRHRSSLCYVERMEPRLMLAFNVLGDPTLDPTTLTLQADADGSVGAIMVNGTDLELGGMAIGGVDLSQLTTINVLANGFSNTSITLDNADGGMAGLDVNYEGGAGVNNSLRVLGDAGLGDAFTVGLIGAGESSLSLVTGAALSLDVDISDLSGFLRLDGGQDDGDTLTVEGTAGNDRVGLNAQVSSGTSIDATGFESIDVDLSLGGNDYLIVTSSFDADVDVEIQGGGGGSDRLIVLTTVGKVGQDVEIDTDSIDVLGKASLRYSSLTEITLRARGGDDTVSVHAEAATATDIRVRGEEGNDLLLVHGTSGDDLMTIGVDTVLTNGALSIGYDSFELVGLNGGHGNDTLKGTTAANVLIGGEGQDILRAGGGADLLIGGDRADRLFGQNGEDLIIGGRTEFDAHARALLSVMSEWNSARSFQERADNLFDGSGSVDRLNGDFFLNSAIVLSHEDENELTGDTSDSFADVFFASESDLNADLTADFDLLRQIG